MTSTYKVAVIICNKNYDKWVYSCIQSVDNTSYPKENISIFIVDDASTDNSIKEIERAACDISVPVNLIKCRNHVGYSKGHNIAINKALEEFDPDVFIMLDSDDEFLPGKIEKSIELWETDKENIGVIYTDYFIVDNNGNSKKEFKPEFFHLMLLYNNMVHSCSMVSKKAILDCGMYDEKIEECTCQDYDLWMRIAKKYVIKHIPEFLMKTRVTGDNYSLKISDNHPIRIRDLQYIREKNAQTIYS